MFSTSFDQEEIRFNQAKRAKAFLATLLFGALLLLAFYLIKLTIPDPPFPELAGGGVEINFGYDASGTGDEQAFSENPGPMTETPVASNASASSPDENNLLTQEEEETDVVVKKTDEVTPKPKKETIPTPPVKPKNNNTNTNTTTKTNTPNTEPEQKADPNALFPTKGAKGSPNKSQGDGTGGGKGDQGSPDGDPNSKSYLGGGDGDGSGPGKGGGSGGGFSLKNRKKVTLPSPQACSGKGKVVIAIRVDRSGKVIEATFKRFESTVFDECNKKNALQAAYNARFNADPNADEIQEGTITYINEVK